MKTLSTFGVFFVAALIALPSVLSARDKLQTNSDGHVERTANDRPLDQKTLFSGASIDTFVLAEFTFDNPDGTCNSEGWTSIDMTAPAGVFFHIDDFAGLGGGDFGRLTPLSGARSLWCGVGADSTSDVFCGFVSLPGYGNYWSQVFESVPTPVSGDATLSYQIRWDVEPGYDYVYVEFADTSGEWIELASYTGIGESSDSWLIPAGAAPDSIRMRFRFEEDGAYNDQDGLWDTDGAVIIDSLTVSDTTGVVDHQNFESDPLDGTSTADGHWFGRTGTAFGDYAGLFQGSLVLQEDPCVNNMTCLWGFFAGSTEDYGCGGHPEQPAVPKGNDQGQYMHNEIWSPWIDWTHDVNGTPVPTGASLAFFEFDVYVDLPLDNLIFYTWFIRARVDGCPQIWEGDDFLHHDNGDPKWRMGWRGRRDIAVAIPANATEVQLNIGTRDTCPFHCGWIGSGDCHSHAPLIDNVKLIRINTPGPVFAPYDLSYRQNYPSLFQDNFPEIVEHIRPGSGEVTSPGRVRVDTGRDLLLSGYYHIIPEDSLTIIVAEPTYGLAIDASGGPAVYMHVKDLPGKSGPVISGGPRWTEVPWLTGGGWTVVRMDTIVPANPHREDVYCVDLNDNLYEAGDTISYYFSAYDGLGNSTFWSEHTGTMTEESAVRAFPMEMTCLPANGLNGATDILIVDAHDGGGVQPYFDFDFKVLGITPDRYDIHHSGWDNGLDARVKDVAQQLIPYYRKIIWSSGNKTDLIMGDGSSRNTKSDDLGALYTFLDEHPEDCGVYFVGDNLAEYWGRFLSSLSSSRFRDKFMNFSVINSDHNDAGEPLSPLGVGQTGECFDGDTLVVHGGCPVLREFDVLSPTGASALAMTYSGNPANCAVLAQETLNADSAYARVLLSGFGFDAIHDDRIHTPHDRVAHLHAVLDWLGNTLDEPTGVGDDPRYRFELSQNHPNPFNPTTKIRFTIRERSHVSLRVYNVAGQEVARLVDDFKTAGPYSVTWDGKSGSGAPVSSGVYFYRLVAGSRTLTKKMVLLK